MRRILAIISCLLAVFVTLPTQAAEEPKVLVLGDSLSAGFGLRPGEGWVTLLEQRLQSQGYGHRVVNASVTGETTDGGLLRLPRALSLHRPAIVVIELGGNDGLRGLPIANIRRNLSDLITRSQQSGAHVVLAGMRIPSNYGQRYTDSFHAVYGQLAAEHKVALVSFFLDGVALQETLFQDDGIHPNARAQPIMLDNLWAELQPLL